MWTPKAQSPLQHACALRRAPTSLPKYNSRIGAWLQLVLRRCSHHTLQRLAAVPDPQDGPSGTTSLEIRLYFSIFVSIFDKLILEPSFTYWYLQLTKNSAKFTQLLRIDPFSQKKEHSRPIIRRASGLPWHNLFQWWQDDGGRNFDALSLLTINPLFFSCV